MDFIREKIKDKPISKKQILWKVSLAVVAGVAFAITVILILLVLRPFENPNATSADSQSETSTQQDSETTQEPNPFPEDLNMSLSEYQNLQEELYQIGEKANKAVVTITEQKDKDSWAAQTTTQSGQKAGVIVLSDSNYIYVLTEKNAIDTIKAPSVTFVDGTNAKATLLKYDGNTGITILTVEKRLLSSETKSAIAVLPLSKAPMIKNGTLVIALGSPLGNSFSITTGNITSIEKEVTTIDKNYSMLTTNMVATSAGSGVLINTAGELVGVVMQSLTGEENVSALTAVSIVEVKQLIATLCQGKDVAYVGAYVSTVTDKIAKEYKLPLGVYVKELVTDSPAMDAGIQSGDVITHINDVEVKTDAQYSAKIEELIPGTNCEITLQRQNGDSYYEVTCIVELDVLK